MLSTRDTRIARKVKRRLSEITPVRQLVVYGSRARGKPAKYSDLDLYIELDTKVSPVLRKKNPRDRVGGQPGFWRGHHNAGCQ